VALESPDINHMSEDNFIDNGIPLSNVISKILAEVIEYFKARSGWLNVLLKYSTTFAKILLVMFGRGILLSTHSYSIM
jgi:hypothetical protein